MDSMQQSPRQGFGGWRDRRREVKAAKRQRKVEKEVALREAERHESAARTYRWVK